MDSDSVGNRPQARTTGAHRARPATVESVTVNVEGTSRVPLATQIAKQISWQVATGRIAAGSSLPAMVDLAAQVGVNVHTVRAAYRQLADDGIVAMGRGTRTRVLGYDRIRALGGGDPHPSFTIGVLVSSFDIFYSEYLDTLTSAAEAEGWLPIICRAQGYAPEVVTRRLDQLFSRNVDGIILTHFERLGNEELVQTLRSSAALRPLVLVDCADIAAGSRVAVNHAAGAYLAAEHLIGHGHVRVGHLGPPADRSSAALFRSGYERALAQAGLPLDEQLIVAAEDFLLPGGTKAALELLQLQDPPTAVMCPSDASAFGVIAAARDLGLQVPEDLAVMGYGDLPLSRLAVSPISTVHIPADRFAYEAIQTLRKAIEDGKSQSTVTIPTSLVPRESCGCTSP